jgi:hypothetical protein
MSAARPERAGDAAFVEGMAVLDAGGPGSHNNDQGQGQALGRGRTVSTR